MGVLARRRKRKAFCPTGPGGGVDPTCGSGGRGESGAGVERMSYLRSELKQRKEEYEKISKERLSDSQRMTLFDEHSEIWEHIEKVIKLQSKAPRWDIEIYSGTSVDAAKSILSEGMKARIQTGEGGNVSWASKTKKEAGDYGKEVGGEEYALVVITDYKRSGFKAVDEGGEKPLVNYVDTPAEAIREIQIYRSGKLSDIIKNQNWGGISSSKSLLATQLIKTITQVIRLKERSKLPELQKAVARSVFLSQFKDIEKTLTDKIEDLIRRQGKSAVERLRKMSRADVELMTKAFCPTGPGGGVDPTCGSGGGRGSERDTRKYEVSRLEDLESVVDGMFGRRLGTGVELLKNLADLSGAEPGSLVRMSWSDTGIMVDSKSDDFRSIRIIKARQGAMIVKNDELYVAKTGGGLGTKIFHRQVEAAVRLGFDRLETRAVRNESMNGAYTWARLGYDGDLPFESKYKLQGDTSAPEWLKSAKTIHELMTRPGGREWWINNSSSFHGTFDLKEGSKSRRILEYYIEEKGRRAASREPAGAKSRGRGDIGRDLGQDWEGRKSVSLRQIFNPSDWNHELVKTVLPPLAKIMAESMVAQTLQMRQDLRKRKSLDVMGIKCGGPGSGRPGPCPGGENKRSDIHDWVESDQQFVLQNVVRQVREFADSRRFGSSLSAWDISEHFRTNKEKAADKVVEAWFSNGYPYPDIQGFEVLKSGKPYKHEGAKFRDFVREYTLGFLPSKSTKASTATDWLDTYGDEDLTFEDELFETPYGDVTMKFATEYPQWMKDRIKERLKETFEQPYWKGINETTGGDIDALLDRGLRDGLSIEDMAKEMNEKFGGAYPRSRGRLIARTEAGNALNGARSDAIDGLIEELGMEQTIKKVWLSVLGNTTRDEHADLDGVPADKNGLWDMVGYKVRWPGDVHLPADLRINCQCSLISAYGMTDEEAEELIAEHLLRQGSRQRRKPGKGRGKKKSFEEEKAFCPTGPGGGVDPTCGSGGGGLRSKVLDDPSGGGSRLLDEVEADLPKAFADSVKRHVKGFKFFNNSEEVSQAAFGNKKFGAAGAFDADSKIVYVSLDPQGMYPGAVLAHELGHALDHQSQLDFPISKSIEWRSAWRTEIKEGKLSKYAATSEAEGFAEFGRSIYMDAGKTKTQFPECWKVWESYGYVN